MPHDGTMPPASARRQIQRVHAMRRYEQRYGAELYREMYDHLSERLWRFISRGDGWGVERRVGHSEYFIRCGNGATVIAVWDEYTQQISTFLPLAEKITRPALESHA